MSNEQAITRSKHHSAAACLNCLSSGEWFFISSIELFWLSLIYFSGIIDEIDFPYGLSLYNNDKLINENQSNNEENDIKIISNES